MNFLHQLFVEPLITFMGYFEFVASSLELSYVHQRSDSFDMCQSTFTQAYRKIFSRIFQKEVKRGINGKRRASQEVTQKRSAVDMARWLDSCYFHLQSWWFGSYIRLS